ncbi:MAG: polysaccharide pyruvyl transferase family protein [Thermosphaera sp.]
MVKVGILTFHWANHIGAVLQAYALHRLLESLGHETYIINYRPTGLRLVTSFVIRPDELIKKYFGILRPSFQKIVKSILGEFIYCLFDLPRETRKTLVFNSFREKYLKIKPKKNIEDIEELRQECSSYNAIIVGSDLVWNPETLMYSSCGYLLPFKLKNTMKIGFSASIGVEFSKRKELLTLYRYFLRDFKFISIRERRHAEALSKILNRNVYHTLDPTLLVYKEIFEELSHNKKKHNMNIELLPERYILFYNLEPNILPFIEPLEKLLNLPVIIYKVPIIIREKLSYGKWLKNKVSFYHMGPQDFISLLKYADLVFTDSYHGLTLSILFEKPVLVAMSSSPSRARIKSRIEDLVELLGLQGRVVRRREDIVKALREDLGDYSTVRSKLRELRRTSIELLKEALKP